MLVRVMSFAMQSLNSTQMNRKKKKEICNFVYSFVFYCVLMVNDKLINYLKETLNSGVVRRNASGSATDQVCFLLQIAGTVFDFFFFFPP